MSAPAPLPRPLAASDREALLTRLWQATSAAAAEVWTVPVADVRRIACNPQRRANQARRAALAAMRWLAPWASIPALARGAGYSNHGNVKRALEILPAEIRAQGGTRLLERIATVTRTAHDNVS